MGPHPLNIPSRPREEGRQRIFTVVVAFSIFNCIYQCVLSLQREGLLIFQCSTLHILLIHVPIIFSHLPCHFFSVSDQLSCRVSVHIKKPAFHVWEKHSICAFLVQLTLHSIPISSSTRFPKITSFSWSGCGLVGGSVSLWGWTLASYTQDTTRCQSASCCLLVKM